MKKESRQHLTRGMIVVVLLIGSFADTCNWGGLRGWRVQKWNEWRARSEIWKDDGRFHKLIGQADRMRILRGGRHELESGTGRLPVVFETTDAAVLEEFHQRIEFAAPELALSHCSCHGDTVLELCRGERLILQVVVFDGQMLWCEHFRSGRWWFGNAKTGNVWLSSASSGWLSRKLASLGAGRKELVIPGKPEVEVESESASMHPAR